jgi:hypothetical protein
VLFGDALPQHIAANAGWSKPAFDRPIVASFRPPRRALRR